MDVGGISMGAAAGEAPAPKSLAPCNLAANFNHRAMVQAERSNTRACS